MQTTTRESVEDEVVVGYAWSVLIPTRRQPQT